MKDATRLHAVQAAGLAGARAGKAHLGGMSSARRLSRSLPDYVALAKPRLNLLVVFTSGAAFYLTPRGISDPLALAMASIGTALVAGAAAALNQVYERDTDALMVRTRTRPLPSGRLEPAEGRAFGLALAAAGLSLLALGTNALAASLALATLVIYLAVYTPLKRRSPAATLVGAIPGALPALIGWTAGQGVASAGGWTLFAIVFLWQMPHFMAIAWMYRDDYARAGFPMLPVLEADGRRTGRQAALYAAALIPASLTPVLFNVAGWLYGGVALTLGIALLVLSIRFARARTDASARALFLGSITYLPLIWAVMMFDRP